MGPWANYLTSESHGFITCKMELRCSAAFWWGLDEIMYGELLSTLLVTKKLPSKLRYYYYDYY